MKSPAYQWEWAAPAIDWPQIVYSVSPRWFCLMCRRNSKSQLKCIILSIIIFGLTEWPWASLFFTWIVWRFPNNFMNVCQQCDQVHVIFIHIVHVKIAYGTLWTKISKCIPKRTKKKKDTELSGRTYDHQTMQLHFFFGRHIMLSNAQHRIFAIEFTYRHYWAVFRLSQENTENISHKTELKMKKKNNTKRQKRRMCVWRDSQPFTESL